MIITTLFTEVDRQKEIPCTLEYSNVIVVGEHYHPLLESIIGKKIKIKKLSLLNTDVFRLGGLLVTVGLVLSLGTK